MDAVFLLNRAWGGVHGTANYYDAIDEGRGDEVAKVFRDCAAKLERSK